MIGQTLKGRYSIEAELYQDKIGKAYKCTDIATGSPVIALVLDAQISAGPQAVTAITEAAAAITELQSPLLVPVSDSGTENGVTFFVFPLGNAVPLRALVSGGLPMEQVAELGFQLAMGVSMASSMGLPHLDLSGNSVMVTVSGDGKQCIRLTRYGFASLLPQYTTAIKNDMFYGTPEYMAPEICSGKGPDARSDIYSAGIVLYEMVVGKCPFISNNTQTVMKRQIFEKPLPLHLLKRNVTGINELEAIVVQALQKMPAKRQESAAELMGQLDNFRTTLLPGLEFAPLPEAAWGQAPAAKAAPRPEPVKPPVVPEPKVEKPADKEQPVEGDTLRMDYAPVPDEVVEEVASYDGAFMAPTREEKRVETVVTPEESGEVIEAIPEPAPKPAPAPKEVKPVEQPKPRREEAPRTGPHGEKVDDEGWFVESPHELVPKEVQQAWSEKKTDPPSSLKFFVAIGIFAVILVAVVAIALNRDAIFGAGEAEKARVAAEQAAEEAKIAAEVKAEEDKKKAEEEAKIAAQKAEEERIAKQKAEELEAQKREEIRQARMDLESRYDLARQNSEALRAALVNKRGEWSKVGNTDEISAIDKTLTALDNVMSPAKLEALTQAMDSDNLNSAEQKMKRLEGQMAAFKVRADGLLAKEVPQAQPEGGAVAEAAPAEQPAEAAPAEQPAPEAAPQPAAAPAPAVVEAPQPAPEPAAQPQVQRSAEDAQKAEEARQAREAAKAAKAAEKAQKAEEARQAREAAKAEKARKAEEARQAREAAKAEKAAKAAEAKKARDEAKAAAIASGKAPETKKKAKEETEAKKEPAAAAAPAPAPAPAAGGADAEKGKRFLQLGIETFKKGNYALSIKYFDKAKQYLPNPTLADKWIQKAKDASAGAN